MPRPRRTFRASTAARVLALFTCAGVASAAANPNFGPVPLDEPHDGFTVVRARLNSTRDARLVESLARDRWSCGAGARREADFEIRRTDLSLLDAGGIRYQIVVPDVGELLRADEASRVGVFQDRGFFDEFQDYAGISGYVNSLVSAYPAFARRASLGLSLQSREIFALRLTSPVPAIGASPRKPVVVITSLQHAREWITPMGTLFTATRMLETYESDSRVRAALDRFEIVFVPMCNPDGYAMTWGGSRLWRKNARASTTGVGSIFGVDNNRNWSVGWGLNSGSSSSTGSEEYRGTAAFSEPENQVIANYALLTPKVVAWLDVHSYAAKALRTWAYQNALPPGLPTFDRIGHAMVDSIFSVSGITYQYGGPEILYLASGTAPDWAYGTFNAPAFTIELNSPSGGFVPPASSIISSGNEAAAAILAFVGSLCPADFNLDGAVDDADFQLFVGPYDALLDNACDLTGDGLTDDADFGLFVAAYDTLACPG
ncbi:MAG: hypothetical protein JNM86_02825 [Phycisphaerae bacterium]|nr:hypothetical protein [Phycisphaerae bacterium]MBN8596134.1 hypothetical protein [Planctomycetota bacterium]